MENTTWFEEKSDDEKLIHLSKLMYSSEENAKKDFGTLLKLLPVDLVLHFFYILYIVMFGRSSWNFYSIYLIYFLHYSTLPQ